MSRYLMPNTKFFLLYLAYSCFCWWWFHCCLCCWYFGVPLSQKNTEWKKIFLGVNVAFVEIYAFCFSIWWWFSYDRIFSECVNDFGVILVLRNAKNLNFNKTLCHFVIEYYAGYCVKYVRTLSFWSLKVNFCNSKKNSTAKIMLKNERKPRLTETKKFHRSISEENHAKDFNNTL